jgi:hypothetical protein
MAMAMRGFGVPAADMGLPYLEYNVTADAEESTRPVEMLSPAGPRLCAPQRVEQGGRVILSTSASRTCGSTSPASRQRWRSRSTTFAGKVDAGNPHGFQLRRLTDMHLHCSRSLL